MSSVWGNHIKLSLFGESHGAAVGITIDDLPSGFPLDLDEIGREMKRRAPGRNAFSTPRQESDLPEIVSGFYNGKTTGTPLCAVIKNTDTRSKDYANLADCPRPGHADYTGAVRYGGFNDPRGGGHFSGRLTAPIVFAGALCKQLLAERGVRIGAHIMSIKDISDRAFDPAHIQPETLIALTQSEFPTLEPSVAEKMKKTILNAKEAGDSVGGVIECAVIGIPAGVGDPFFDSVESVLSSLLFSIPAVKGVSFGAGFGITELFGSEANDPFCIENGEVKTKTNHNGGILGGITSGMPVVFQTAVKPTASIAKAQQTVSLSEKKETELSVSGRHDPCIVLRAVPVVEAMAAIGIFDLMKGQEAWKL